MVKLHAYKRGRITLNKIRMISLVGGHDLSKTQDIYLDRIMIKRRYFNN